MNRNIGKGMTESLEVSEGHSLRIQQLIIKREYID